MTSWTIANGKNRPLTFQQGTVPDVSGAMKDYFQTMVFTQIVKSVVGFENLEVPTNTTFEGVIMPFSPRQMLLLPEGQRAWTIFDLYADPVLALQVDEVITWNEKQTRVMSRKDYDMYGYVNYVLCQDWTGSGPNS